ncbi:MAG: hypothetical protein WHW07_12315 [Bacteroidales bacterium]
MGCSLVTQFPAIEENTYIANIKSVDSISMLRTRAVGSNLLNKSTNFRSVSVKYTTIKFITLIPGL